MCLRGSNGSTTICSVPLISALQKLFRMEGVQVQVSLSFGKTQISIAILILDEIFTCKMDSHLPRLQNPEKVWRVMKENRKNWTHLPSCETGCAEKVTTRLDPDVFAVLGADFTQLQQENNSNPLDKTYRWKVKTVPLHHIHVAGCLEACVNFISSEISFSTIWQSHHATISRCHNLTWKVLPISQYSSYCSCVTFTWSSGVACTHKNVFLQRMLLYHSTSIWVWFHVFAVFSGRL